MCHQNTETCTLRTNPKNEVWNCLIFLFDHVSVVLQANLVWRHHPRTTKYKKKKHVQVVAVDWILTFQIKFAGLKFISGPYQWWAALGCS